MCWLEERERMKKKTMAEHQNKKRDDETNRNKKYCSTKTWCAKECAGENRKCPLLSIIAAIEKKDGTKWRRRIRSEFSMCESYHTHTQIDKTLTKDQIWKQCKKKQINRFDLCFRSYCFIRFYKLPRCSLIVIDAMGRTATVAILYL